MMINFNRIKLQVWERAHSGRRDLWTRICRFIVVDSTVTGFPDEKSGKELNHEAMREQNDLFRIAIADAEEKVSELRLKVRNHPYELEEKQKSILAKLVKTMNAQLMLSLDEQVERCNWSIWESENSDGYCLTTGFCIIGGCDARYIEFSCQQAALLYGAVLDEIGVKPTSDSACSTCYAEYMQNCI